MASFLIRFDGSGFKVFTAFAATKPQTFATLSEALAYIEAGLQCAVREQQLVEDFKKGF